jgi:Mg/Co/Ni transporter MgtE
LENIVVKLGFKLLHPQQAVEVMEELDYNQRLYILSNIKPQYSAYLLREMAADEVADFIGDLPPNST